jgi:maleate isomerase
MLQDELPRAIGLIRTTAPQVVVFGCTSAGALGTLAHDREIENKIRAGTGARVITVLGAALKQLSIVGARRVALFTPYVEDLTNSIGSSLSEAGYTPVKAVGMGIEANLEIGRVRPFEIVRFVESHLGGLSFDSLFLSCTNWRSVEILGCLREKFGVPIVSSNQAAMDEVRRLAANPNRAGQ